MTDQHLDPAPWPPSHHAVEAKRLDEYGLLVDAAVYIVGSFVGWGLFAIAKSLRGAR